MTLQFSPSGLIHSRTYNFYYLEVVFLKLWTYYDSIGSPLKQRSWINFLSSGPALSQILMQDLPSSVYSKKGACLSPRFIEYQVQGYETKEHRSTQGNQSLWAFEITVLSRPTAHSWSLHDYVLLRIHFPGDHVWLCKLTRCSLFGSFSLWRYGFEFGNSACIM